MRNWLSTYSRALLLITLLLASTAFAQQISATGSDADFSNHSTARFLP